METLNGQPSDSDDSSGYIWVGICVLAVVCIIAEAAIPLLPGLIGQLQANGLHIVARSAIW